MRICRFDDNRLGVVDDNVIHDVTQALDVLPAQRYPLPTHDLLYASLDLVRRRIDALTGLTTRSLDSVTLLSPVANPGTFVAAPVNYQAHFDEAEADKATFDRALVRKIQDTGLFLKATSSMIGSGSPIRIANPERRTDHELELAVKIGKPCYRTSRQDALDYVAGYTIGLDISIRRPEERSLRKSLDTYSVLGPWLVTADEFGDPSGRKITLDVDGKPRQRANTNSLNMDVRQLIVFASSFYTLYPSDVIFTGTPDGVGPILPGQTITAEIEGIGKLEVVVASM
jgi:2,4-diketo-3-deoxy-L-fuconate hydrolase